MYNETSMSTCTHTHNYVISSENYTIPSDSNCVLGIYGLNRHPVWGPDAHTFRPERWLELGGVPDDPNAFAGFSVGKRNCIGKYNRNSSIQRSGIPQEQN
uniref:Cytochrome P450 n=1 Tax=Bombyx mori TaxID=7091 RepID=A0A8R2M7G1_BOMMO|nr:cytochrome P450 86A1-like [Bombyx mori]